MADKLPPEQLAYQRAHIDETRQPLLYGIFSMLAALTIIFTGLRLLCRRMRKLKLGPDDIACIFAMCFFLGTTVTNFIATYNGVVPIIWKLKTTATQKVGLSLVFGVGIIACISSIMRIVTTARVDSNDSSYQSTEPLIWAATELSTSVIAASMPCLLPIVYKFRNGCRRLISTLSSGTRSPVQGSLDNPSSGKKKGVKVEAKEVPGSGENSEKNQDGVELRSFEHVHRNSQRNDGFEAALDLENGTISEEKDEKTLT
ncbi:MAG: hypothetical protein M1814_005061 [Vezdaea aestivalis]|nr:MAG: hypothetical protein M1814_005061 [Vezdaea aestivalis]